MYVSKRGVVEFLCLDKVLCQLSFATCWKLQGRNPFTQRQIIFTMVMMNHICVGIEQWLLTCSSVVMLHVMYLSSSSGSIDPAIAIAKREAKEKLQQLDLLLLQWCYECSHSMNHRILYVRKFPVISMCDLLMLSQPIQQGGQMLMRMLSLNRCSKRSSDKTYQS